MATGNAGRRIRALAVDRVEGREMVVRSEASRRVEKRIGSARGEGDPKGRGDRDGVS